MLTYGLVIYSEDQPCLYDVHCREKENPQKSIKVALSDGISDLLYVLIVYMFVYLLSCSKGCAIDEIGPLLHESRT